MAAVGMSVRNAKRSRIEPLEPTYKSPDTLNWKPKNAAWNAIISKVQEKITIQNVVGKFKQNAKKNKENKDTLEIPDVEQAEKSGKSSTKSKNTKKKFAPEPKKSEWKPRETPISRCMLKCSIVLLVFIFLLTTFGFIFIIGGYELFCIDFFETSAKKLWIEARQNATNQTCPSL